MDEEAALLKAVKSGDTVAQLVYADWLDEHNRPVDAVMQRILAQPDKDEHRLRYASICGSGAKRKFIELQVEAAKLKDFGLATMLERGANTLLLQCPEWRPHCPQCLGHYRRGCAFCDSSGRVGLFYRGFLHRVTAPSFEPVMSSWGQYLVRGWPTVQALLVRDRNPHLSRRLDRKVDEWSWHPGDWRASACHVPGAVWRHCNAMYNTYSAAVTALEEGVVKALKGQTDSTPSAPLVS